MADAETRERIESFGMALRLARVKAGLHQTDVAKMIKVHATAVSQLERGERAELPDERTILQLDEALGADGELAASAGLKVSADKRRKPRRVIEIDATDLDPTQVREIQRIVDVIIKGYLTK